MSDAFKKTAASANPVKKPEWIGLDDEAMKADYGLAEIPEVEKNSLIGVEVIIVGYIVLPGKKRPSQMREDAEKVAKGMPVKPAEFVVYHAVSEQEPTVFSFAAGDKALRDKVSVSDMPVRGVIREKSNANGTYLTIE